MAPLWLPIVTALIAALSALAGVLLNSYLARRDLAVERLWKARQESKDFLLARGEDLYVHLDQLDAHVERHCWLIQAFCGGTLSFHEYGDRRRAALEERDKFSVAKIKLTVRAFFPGLTDLYEELADNLERVDTLDRALADAREHDAKLLYRANADAIRLQKLVADQGEQLRGRLVKLLSEIFISRSDEDIGIPAQASRE